MFLPGELHVLASEARAHLICLDVACGCLFMATADTYQSLKFLFSNPLHLAWTLLIFLFLLLDHGATAVPLLNLI